MCDNCIFKSQLVCELNFILVQTVQLISSMCFIIHLFIYIIQYHNFHTAYSYFCSNFYDSKLALTTWRNIIK